MGPALIADKSVCQGLNPKLVNRLHSLFFPVFTTVLFRECAGNLGKHADIESSITEFQKTAKVIRAGQGRFSPDVQTLLDMESKGIAFDLDGRPVVIPVSVKNDDASVLIDEEDERSFIRRWTEKEFLAGEREFWGGIRQGAKSYPLEAEYVKLKKHLPKVDAVDEAFGCVEGILSDSQKIDAAIDSILAVTQNSPRSILERIRSGREHEELRKYPYHEHVLRITLIFYILLVSNLIGTRSTNRLDLEYLFYLPFCKVFASGDTDQKTVFEASKMENCVCLSREELREGLEEIEEYFKSFSTQDLKHYRSTYGLYPPPIPNSPICSIWERFLGERKIIDKKIHHPDMGAIRKDYMSHFK